MKRVLAAAVAAWALIGCGGGGGASEPVAADPIDRYVGKWLRCDAVGSANQSWNVQTEWTVTKTGPDTGQLVVHEMQTSACGTPPAPTAERKQIATGQLRLSQGQHQAQGETWERAGIQVRQPGDDCSPSPSVCSMFSQLVQLSGNTLRTSLPPVLSAPRLVMSGAFSRGADGLPSTFDVTVLTKACSSGCGAGGDVPPTADPIDRYVGTWRRCDVVGTAASNQSVQTEWTFTRTSPTTSQLVVHETPTSACGTPPAPAAQRQQIASGRLSLDLSQQQAQGETWDSAGMQVRKVGESCAPSPSACSTFPAVVQQSGNTLRTSWRPVLTEPRLAPFVPITLNADGSHATFEVTVLTRQ